MAFNFDFSLLTEAIYRKLNLKASLPHDIILLVHLFTISEVFFEVSNGRFSFGSRNMVIDFLSLNHEQLSLQVPPMCCLKDFISLLPENKRFIVVLNEKSLS